MDAGSDGVSLVEDGGQDYLGGCINEVAEWDWLCPFPEFGACDDAPTGAFGRYHCFGWDSMFLWAREDSTSDDYDRNALLYSPDTGGAPNDSVWAEADVPGCD
jgi:hypothetical protein